MSTAVGYSRTWWFHLLRWIDQSRRLQFLHKLPRAPFKIIHVSTLGPHLDQTQGKESTKYPQLSLLKRCLSSLHRKHLWCLAREITQAREIQLRVLSFNQATQINSPDLTQTYPSSLLKMHRPLLSMASSVLHRNPSQGYAIAEPSLHRPKTWLNRISKQSMSSAWSFWRPSLRGSSGKTNKLGGKEWIATSR